MVELTKDTDKLLCVAYKCYLERAKTCEKSEAMIIPKDFYIDFKGTSSMSQHDVHHCLYELKKAELCKLFIDDSFKLQPKAIVYMESRFKNGLKDVIDFILQFVP